jgi:Zn-dependent membrane protease YugP
MGNKALNYGNDLYVNLNKGMIPIFVIGIAGSVILLLLGIFFGKKLLAAGLLGIFICLCVVVFIHYLPEIAVSFKSAAGSAIKP